VKQQSLVEAFCHHVKRALIVFLLDSVVNVQQWGGTVTAAPYKVLLAVLPDQTAAALHLLTLFHAVAHLTLH
jgi:hypothetical protein